MATLAADALLESPAWALAALGRPERRVELEVSLGRVLVTGAHGALGTLLAAALPVVADDTLLTDLATMDVRNVHDCYETMNRFRPDVVFHLAGAKHAPEGEVDPLGVLETNAIGTRNVLAAAGAFGAKVVVSSTCKACDPETAYGASKLLAERMTLNAHQTVVRFFNVANTYGNVFETWHGSDGDIAVTPCVRRFMTAREAVTLMLWAGDCPEPGRFILDGTSAREMRTVARELFPDRSLVPILPRRGDRLVEPEMATSETKEIAGDWIARVRSPHDPEGET